MTQGMLSLFWGEEHKVKYGPQLSGALRDMFKEKGLDHVDLQMDALITVAKKAEQELGHCAASLLFAIS